MKAKFYTFGNNFIFILFYFLFGITYVSVILSENFILGDNLKKGTTTTIGLVLFFLIILAVISLICFIPRIKQIFTFIFIQHKMIAAITLFFFLILAQILFVTVFHPKIGWDPSALVGSLHHVDDANNKAYFSLNVNNLPILLFMEVISSVFKLRTWLFLDYVTIFMVDVSIIFSVAAVYTINKKYLAPALYIHIFLFAFFPWVIVPYTDTWVLPFISGFLFFYFCSKKVKQPWIKFTLLVGFSMCVCIAYFIKPSAIIPAIAIVLISLFSLLEPKLNHTLKIRSKICMFIVVLLTFIFCYTIIQNKVDQQTFISVNKERAIPAIHFMNMGISGDGGYNPKDTLKMGELATKSEKTQYSKQSYFKRLKALGPIGYIRFLIKKQINNSADGSFAWGKEGSFIQGKQIPKATGIKRILEDYLYIYGEKVANFRFITQFIWLIILSFIFFGWRNRSEEVQTIRLGIIGAFLFLLLFEGGRSRYIIQFLPLFLIGATLLIPDTNLSIKRIFNIILLKKSNYNT
ncbi:hypothetical protein ESZ47_02820 [Leuconostoc litchii]|uniref:Glycosyltransferase RgtA/B/C/D-like domain-containing protein n=2 Tax=Leuconostoc litchii TaxID=1981069 RepID=A0A6P2CP67_9LACO|nr:hypothetical protein ESZ47_02820 [Leuconostoc litchii]